MGQYRSNKTGNVYEPLNWKSAENIHDLKKINENGENALVLRYFASSTSGLNFSRFFCT